MAEKGEVIALRRELIRYPELVTYRSTTGSTLLHYAAEKGRDEVVELLLQYRSENNILGHLEQFVEEFARRHKTACENIIQSLRVYETRNPSLNQGNKISII